MIKKTEFAMQMERIDKYFPKSFYPEEKLERIWQKVKYLTKEDVIRVFDFILDNSRFAPIPDEFNKAIRACGIDVFASQMASNGHNTCNSCKGSGLVLASKKTLFKINQDGTHGNVWDNTQSFRCHCDLGNLKDKNIMQWGNQAKSLGYFLHIS